jgi:RHS repeat-associated protein
MDMTPSFVYAKQRLESESRSTGKERDAESGNDYFEARYYSSSAGRFMSPDWSAKEEPVPYAVLGDPQSLNLYAYVRNNPLIRADLDGHDFVQDAGKDWILKHQITNASLAQMASAGLERHLFMVGDPGLGHHNQGGNFVRAAKTAADEAWKNGEVPTMTRVSSGQDIANALTSNGPLSGADYFGHASGDRLYPGETAISGSNLDQSNVGSLSSKNMDKNAVFTIHACFGGSGGSNGIAGMISNQLRRMVRAYDGPTIFSTNPLGPDGRTQPPAQGPLYLVPDHGTHLTESYPQ